MDIDVICDWNIIELKNYIMDNVDNPDIISLLKDNRIKEKVIDADYQDFIMFLNFLPFEIINNLLDSRGIELLKNNCFMVKKIEAIVKNYHNEPNLFKNEYFSELVCKEKCYNYMLLLNNDISVETAVPLVEYVLASREYISPIFQIIKSIQLEVIKRIEIPYDVLFYVISISSKETAEYLLNYDYRIESLLVIPFDELFRLVSKGIVFSKHLLYEDKFVSWVTTIKNTKKYRIFMDLLAKDNDVSFIEDIRKNYYEEQISSYDEDMDMLADYSKCYKLLTTSSFKEEDTKIIIGILEDCLEMDDDTNHTTYLLDEITYCTIHKKYKKLRRLLRNESHFQLTNMIIDYHFEDIVYNVFLDLRELLRFNFKTRVITEDDVLRYNMVLDLDNFSYQKAKELHEELKDYHYSQFYEHIRNAKDKAIELMEQVMLNEETIQKYRDKELSKQHGVDVYVLDGDEYYALIKSLQTYKDSILEDEITYNTDGSSYTLTNSVNRATYFSPKRMYNIMYSTIPKNQVVHIFSVDSFSNYNREINETASTRVYEIRTPEELVKASRHYNEIVIAVPNSRKEDELNANLQVPKVLGIYCYDKITKLDVISAKNLRIGIVLVKTDKYKTTFETLDKKMSMTYNDLACGGGEESDRFDYIRSIFSEDMVYRKRLHLNKN